MNEKQGEDVVVVTVINLGDEIIEQEEYGIPLFNLERFFKLIEQYLSKHPTIKVIGIGIPGQSVNGEIKVSSHDQLKGVRLSEVIQEQFGLPVVLENDVNAAISGYCSRTEKDDNQCVLGVYFPRSYPP